MKKAGNTKDVSNNLLSQILVEGKEFLFDLLYPRMCITCGKYGALICTDCYLKIDFNRTKTCFYCGKISDNGKICANCSSRHKTFFKKCLWLGSYSDPILKAMVHQYKYEGFYELSEVFSDALAMYIGRWTKDKYLIVPVPIHISRERQRGFNQSELIARGVSGRLHMEGALALERHRNTESQVGKTREQRINNLKDTIICVDKEIVTGRKVLLIDDVATTGTTLNECAKVLMMNGAKRVDVAVVARG